MAGVTRTILCTPHSPRVTRALLFVGFPLSDCKTSCLKSLFFLFQSFKKKGFIEKPPDFSNISSSNFGSNSFLEAGNRSFEILGDATDYFSGDILRKYTAFVRVGFVSYLCFQV